MKKVRSSNMLNVMLSQEYSLPAEYFEEMCPYMKRLYCGWTETSAESTEDFLARQRATLGL